MSDHSCNVTIKNRSSSALRNPHYSEEYGGWKYQPPTHIEKHQQVTFQLEDTAFVPTGTEGQVEYQTDGGSVKLSFQCGYFEDNYVRVECSDDTKRLSFYANDSKYYNWSDTSRWGKEGQYPAKGQPLNILLVVDDREA